MKRRSHKRQEEIENLFGYYSQVDRNLQEMQKVLEHAAREDKPITGRTLGWLVWLVKEAIIPSFRYLYKYWLEREQGVDTSDPNHPLNKED